jgi:hypothetical protein
MTRTLIPSDHYILEWRVPNSDADVRQLITEDKDQALCHAALLRQQGIVDSDMLLIWRVFTHKDFIMGLP